MFHDRTGEYENAGIEQADIYFCSLLPGERNLKKIMTE